MVLENNLLSIGDIYKINSRKIAFLDYTIEFFIIWGHATFSVCASIVHSVK